MRRQLSLYSHSYLYPLQTRLTTIHVSRKGQRKDKLSKFLSPTTDCQRERVLRENNSFQKL